MPIEYDLRGREVRGNTATTDNAKPVKAAHPSAHAAQSAPLDTVEAHDLSSKESAIKMFEDIIEEYKSGKPRSMHSETASSNAFDNPFKPEFTRPAFESLQERIASITDNPITSPSQTHPFLGSEKIPPGLPDNPIALPQVKAPTLLEQFVRKTHDSLSMPQFQPHSFQEARDPSLGFSVNPYAPPQKATSLFGHFSGAAPAGPGAVTDFYSPAEATIVGGDMREGDS